MAGGGTYQMLFQLSASLGGGFNSAFASGSRAITDMQNKINALNKTNSDIAAYQKQQDAIAKTEAKLQRLQGQYDRLAAVEAKTGTEEAELKNKMEDKQDSIDKTNEKLAEQKAKLDSMGAALQKAGVDTSNLAGESARLTDEAKQVAAAQEEEAKAAQDAGNSMKDAVGGVTAALEALGAMKALETVYSTLKDCSEAAAKFETSMAGVKRTVGGDDTFIKTLGESFKEMSTTMPITADELASIATTAGQLGIAQENVETFTQVMAQLATTTDLTADNAATMLAQFANITGTTDYERLGATVAALGDSTATTASKVVEMSQGMAAAANIAGMSETDILAISAAVGSLGIEAASGSTSMSTLITTLYKATQTGNKLEEFASVAGMTADQFKQAWATDAAGALNTFIQGLNDVERNGKSAVVILDELGITNVRQTKAILGLASAGDLLGNTLSQAKSAWSENSALAEKAGIMYNTTEAKMTMLGNAVNNVKVAVGDALNPALAGMADALTSVVEPIAEWIEQNPAVVQGITAFVAVLGIGVVALTAYTAVTKLAAAASALFTASFPPLAIISAVAVGIGVLVGVISALSGASSDSSKTLGEMAAEYEELNKELEEQKNIQNLVDQYESLNKELKNLGNVDAGDIELKAKIEKSGVSEENLKLIQTLKESIDNKKGEIKQILTISGADQVTDENLEKIIQLADGAQDGDHSLEQELAIQGVDDITPENLQKIKDLSSEVVDETDTLKQTLEVEGFESYEEAEKIANLQMSSATYEKLIKLNITNYAEAKQQMKDLGLELFDAKKKLDEAKTELSEMETQASNLQAIIDAKKSSKKQRQEAQEELTDLNEQIEAQKTKVGELTDNYNGLHTEYDEVKAAAQELKAQEEALQSTQEALGLSADDTTQSMEEQAAALKEQAAAQEALVKAKQAELRLNALDTLKSSMVTYSQEAKKFTDATNESNAAVTALGTNWTPETLKNRLLELYSGMMNLIDANPGDQDLWDSANMKAFVQEYEALMTLATGDNYKLTYSRLVGNSPQAIEQMQIDEKTLLSGIKDLGTEIEATSDKAAEHAAKMQSFVDQVVALIESGAMGKEEVTAMLNQAMEEAGESTEVVDEVMKKVNATLEEHAQAAEEAANAEKELANEQENLSDVTGESKATIESVTKNLEDLKEAYKTAYENAYNSMEGQFKLFERVKNKLPKYDNNKGGDQNTKGYTEGLKEQAQYIETYTQNYSAAAEKLRQIEDTAFGGNHDASDSILSQLADGSEESGKTLADLASADEATIKSLIEQYENLEKKKSEYAETVAKQQTEFETKMQQYKEQMEQLILETDFEEDATNNANAAMSAFCEAISGYTGTAGEKAAEVAAAINAALDINPTITVGIKFSLPKFSWGGGDEEGGTEGEAAEGTTNAREGVWLVGEEGPELVYMNGGENVLDADKTADILSGKNAVNATPAISGGGSTYNVTFAPQYNVASGVGADEVRAALQEQSGSLKEELEALLAEITEDESRRKLA